jgi:hypothetical protein
MKQHAIPMAIAASVASIISVFTTVLVVTPSVTQVTLAYEQGRRDVLSLRPVSWDLEMACVNLWVQKQPVMADGQD